MHFFSTLITLAVNRAYNFVSRPISILLFFLRFYKAEHYSKAPFWHSCEAVGFRFGTSK